MLAHRLFINITLHFSIYMDDFPVFENLLSSQRGLNVNHARYETAVFVNSFTALLATSDVEINDSVRITHATNSARPTNGKIMIPASVIVALEASRFELDDRERCGALPLLAALQELD